MESWVALAASHRDPVRRPASPVCAFSGHRPLITGVQTAEEEQVWQRSEGAVIIPESHPLHPPSSCREPAFLLMPPEVSRRVQMREDSGLG